MCSYPYCPTKLFRFAPGGGGVIENVSCTPPHWNNHVLPLQRFNFFESARIGMVHRCIV